MVGVWKILRMMKIRKMKMMAGGVTSAVPVQMDKNRHLWKSCRAKGILVFLSSQDLKRHSCIAIAFCTSTTLGASARRQASLPSTMRENEREKSTGIII